MPVSTDPNRKLSKRKTKLQTSSKYLQKRFKEIQEYKNSFKPVESKVLADNRTFLSTKQTGTGSAKSAQNVYSEGIVEKKYGGSRPDSKFVSVIVNSQTGPTTATGGQAFATIEGDKFQRGNIKTTGSPNVTFLSYEQRQRNIEQYNKELKKFREDQKQLTRKDFKKLYGDESKSQAKKGYGRDFTPKGLRKMQSFYGEGDLRDIDAGTLLLGNKGLKTFKTKVQKLRDQGKGLT